MASTADQLPANAKEHRERQDQILAGLRETYGDVETIKDSDGDIQCRLPGNRFRVILGYKSFKAVIRVLCQNYPNTSIGARVVLESCSSAFDRAKLERGRRHG